MTELPSYEDYLAQQFEAKIAELRAERDSKLARARKFESAYPERPIRKRGGSKGVEAAGRAHREFVPGGRDLDAYPRAPYLDLMAERMAPEKVAVVREAIELSVNEVAGAKFTADEISPLLRADGNRDWLPPLNSCDVGPCYRRLVMDGVLSFDPDAGTPIVYTWKGE